MWVLVQEWGCCNAGCSCCCLLLQLLKLLQPMLAVAACCCSCCMHVAVAHATWGCKAMGQRYFFCFFFFFYVYSSKCSWMSVFLCLSFLALAEYCGENDFELYIDLLSADMWQEKWFPITCWSSLSSFLYSCRYLACMLQLLMHKACCCCPCNCCCNPCHLVRSHATFPVWDRWQRQQQQLHEQ